MNELVCQGSKKGKLQHQCPLLAVKENTLDVGAKVVRLILDDVHVLKLG